MEENTPINPVPEDNVNTTEEAISEPISVTDAMTGVLTEPGETFASIKRTAKNNFWIIPIVIYIVISIVSRFLVTNDEELYTEIKTKQIESVKKRMDEQVKAGKMSQEDANTKMEQMEKGFDKSGAIFLLSITLGPIIGILIILFIKGLIYWGVLKIFQGAATYMQIIIVLSICSIIDSIQVIIDTVLAIVAGRLFANIGPLLLFAKDSLNDTTATLLGHLDLLNIWYFIILGIGLAKLSSLKNTVTIPTVFALWIIWVCLTSFVKIPFFSL